MNSFTTPCSNNMYFLSAIYLLILMITKSVLPISLAISPQEYFDESNKEGILILQDQASAITAASRDDKCTIILFGAPWDGYFKAFLLNGNWNELAHLLRDDRDIELAFFEYHGSPDGPTSIPKELLPVPTLGSYEWYGYRSGKRLWNHPNYSKRECRSYDWRSSTASWDISCFRKLCGQEMILDTEL